MQKTKPFKAGDTFILTCNYTVGGAPSPLPPGIRSQVRTQDDVLLAELELQIVSADEGSFFLRWDGTESWQDTVVCDVQFVDGNGVTYSTSTFEVPIEQDVTHD